MSVFAPGPGILAVGAGPAPSGDQARAHRPPTRKALPFAPARVAVKRAGLVTVRLKLSQVSGALLRHRHTLALSLKLRFTPPGGAAVARTAHLTLRSPACIELRIAPSPKQRPKGAGRIRQVCVIRR